MASGWFIQVEHGQLQGSLIGLTIILSTNMKLNRSSLLKESCLPAPSGRFHLCGWEDPHPRRRPRRVAVLVSLTSSQSCSAICSEPKAAFSDERVPGSSAQTDPKATHSLRGDRTERGTDRQHARSPRKKSPTCKTAAPHTGLFCLADPTGGTLFSASRCFFFPGNPKSGVAGSKKII